MEPTLNERGTLKSTESAVVHVPQKITVSSGQSCHERIVIERPAGSCQHRPE